MTTGSERNLLDEQQAALSDALTAFMPGPAIVALLRQILATANRIEVLLGILARRNQVTLNALDEAIRAADADLLTAAGNQSGDSTATRRSTPMTDPTPPDVTVDQVVTDFGTFRDDVATAIATLQAQLANITIPPAAQTALNSLDAAVKAADAALPPAPPPSV